ncbi:hypothetical protein BJV77DRAFT_786206 [Russula vinacea]|nr:hypothetical protein BJV77DRAFT_786206 [Russula vinacea]
MRSICNGLTHPCLESLSETRLPLRESARLSLERLSELKENADLIALDEMVTSVFPRPAVPAMEWYFNKLGTAINAKPLLESPNSHSPIANMERCFIVTSVIREMEHWHAPYNYPRADHAQAWLLKCLEGAIAVTPTKKASGCSNRVRPSNRLAAQNPLNRT